MKILFISANYPPDHLGGYELRIQDIVVGLLHKGHNILVITTREIKTKGLNYIDGSYPVLRKLHNRYKASFFPKEIIFDLLDTKFLDQIIEEFNPDVIYLGHIYILSKALLPYLSILGIPIILDEGGASLKGAWMEKGRWFRFTGEYQSRISFLNLLKPYVINLVIKLSKGRIQRCWFWPKNLNTIINSWENLKNLQQLGVPLGHTAVLHSGINLEKFTFSSRDSLHSPLKILSPGRLNPRKGIMDSVNLVGRLNQSGIETRLILVGPDSLEEYKQEINEQIRELNIEQNVSILDMVSQSELVSLYQAADICYFPSYQAMGFSRIPLEAMACGCVVISYGGEASREVIEDDVNGYIVGHKDYPAIISIIKKLIVNPSVVKQLTQTARRYIERTYSLENYINQVEDFIFYVVKVV